MAHLEPNGPTSDPQAASVRLQQGSRAAYPKAPFAFALVTLLLLFPLVLVGAGVTSKDAGMAFPDWPTSDGVLLNPPGWWQGEHTRWEHGHRLIGWLVGMSAVVLAVVSWPGRGAGRWLGLGTLLAIGVQGVLGGIRVTEVSTGLAMVHGIWGQVCYCLATLAVLVNSRSWRELGAAVVLRSGQALPRLAIIVTGALVLQLILGAALRHFSGGYVLVAHVLWALPVVFMCGWLVMWTLGLSNRSALPTALAKGVGLLVMAQLALGGFSWLVTLAGGAWPAWLVWMVPTAHVGCGALLLACSVVLTAVLHRLVKAPKGLEAQHGPLPPQSSRLERGISETPASIGVSLPHAT